MGSRKGDLESKGEFQDASLYIVFELQSHHHMHKCSYLWEPVGLNTFASEGVVKASALGR